MRVNRPLIGVCLVVDEVRRDGRGEQSPPRERHPHVHVRCEREREVALRPIVVEDVRIDAELLHFQRGSQIERADATLNES